MSRSLPSTACSDTSTFQPIPYPSFNLPHSIHSQPRLRLKFGAFMLSYQRISVVSGARASIHVSASSSRSTHVPRTHAPSAVDDEPYASPSPPHPQFHSLYATLSRRHVTLLKPSIKPSLIFTLVHRGPSHPRSPRLPGPDRLVVIPSARPTPIPTFVVVLGIASPLSLSSRWTI
jgi:hypothetical protein